MSYTTDDFTESLSRVGVHARQIASVVAAWGKGGGMGEDAGHYRWSDDGGGGMGEDAGHYRWSDDGATEWSGGFLLRLEDGRYCYITGWCDYTGWGCQDGAETYYFDAAPELSALKVASEEGNEPPPEEWDIEPSDLNRWVQRESARLADAVDPSVDSTGKPTPRD